MQPNVGEARDKPPAQEARRTIVARLKGRGAAYVALLTNSIFGGLTAVGVPLALNSAGLSKVEIAIFFVVNAGIAVTYNVALVPRIQARGYPRVVFVLTASAVPVGTLIISLGASNVALLYLGGALMLFVSTIVPQIIGRVAGLAANDGHEKVVADLRQAIIVGFLLGLLIYSLVAAAGIPPMTAAAAVAAVTPLAGLGKAFRERVPYLPKRASSPGVAPRRHSMALWFALAVVALLKSADVLRSIYLPLFAVSSGIDRAAVSPLFALSAVLELAVLPLLTMFCLRYGAPILIAMVALVGACSFGWLLLDQSYLSLLAAQAIYAVFGCGYQTVGLVLLAKVAGDDAGHGASLYTAVIQIGTVLGALLPLIIDGYSVSVFWIALILCAAGAALACFTAASFRTRNAGFA